MVGKPADLGWECGWGGWDGEERVCRGEAEGTEAVDCKTRERQEAQITAGFT